MEGSARTPTLEELLGQGRWLAELARRLVRDAATADDLVQETWLRALGARARAEQAAGTADRPHASEAARPWLARVLRNAWRERGRSEGARRVREARSARAEALPAAHEAVERIELEQRLAALVLGLAEPYRSAVLWHYYDGRSAADLAARLDEPPERVRWRLMRARALLRERLERDQEDWPTRFAVFFPPTADGPPMATSGSSGSAGAAGLGALVMGKWLAGGALAVVLAWVALRLGADQAGGGARRADPAALAPPPAGETAALVAPPASAELERARQPLAAMPAQPSSLPLTTDPRARLGGTVRAAEDGRALAGVELVLFGGNGAVRASTTSDVQGAFLFSVQESGTHELGLRLGARIPRRIQGLELLPGAETRLDAELEPGFEIQVEVAESTDAGPGGPAIAGADVLLIPGDKEAVTWMSAELMDFLGLAGRTDAAGRVVLAGGARGVYHYVVRAEGYAASRGRVLVQAAAEPIPVALERGGVVFGTVLHANGTPAAGARVFLNPIAWEGVLEDFAYRENGLATDSMGSYRLEGVPSGVYHGVALLPDGSGSFHFRPGDPGARQLERILVEPGPEVRLDFHLPRPGRVGGRVLDTAGGALEGVGVSVSWGDFKPPQAGFFPIARVPLVKESIHHATRTDDQGRFALEGLRLSHRALHLTFRRAGHLSNELELDVPAGAELEVEVRLQPLGATLSGRVTRVDGAPVAGQTVGAFVTEQGRLGAFFQAQTRADGSYVLEIPDGLRTHRVYPVLRSSDGLVAEPEKREDVLSGAREVDFVVHPLVALDGTVVDDLGVPVRDFVVSLLLGAPAGAAATWREQRDANLGEGRFRFHADPRRPLEARFSAPGCDTVTRADLLEAGERRIVLPRAGDLVGVLLDRAGRGVPEAVVALATLDSAVYAAGTEFAPRASTDAAGRFRLQGVPRSNAGHLLVCPRREDAPALVHYPLPQQRDSLVTLVLPASLAVELSFQDPAGAPLVGTVLVFDPEGWPLEPAFETHLLDQQSPARGVLVEGRARFQLLAGPHQVVYLRDVNEQRAFRFEVEAGAEEQRVSFVVD